MHGQRTVEAAACTYTRVVITVDSDYTIRTQSIHVRVVLTASQCTMMLKMHHAAPARPLIYPFHVYIMHDRVRISTASRIKYHAYIIVIRMHKCKLHIMVGQL